MCAFAPYDLENVHVLGYDIVTNRPKVAAYRAPGGPIAEFAVESVVDDLARSIGMDPIDFRLKNAAKEGTKAVYGPKFGPVGLVQCLEAAKASDHWKAPLGKNQGRGIAAGFWGFAVISLDRGDWDGALRYYRMALEGGPPNPRLQRDYELALRQTDKLGDHGDR